MTCCLFLSLRKISCFISSIVSSIKEFWVKISDPWNSKLCTFVSSQVILNKCNSSTLRLFMLNASICHVHKTYKMGVFKRTWQMLQGGASASLLLLGAVHHLQRDSTSSLFTLRWSHWRQRHHSPQQAHPLISAGCPAYLSSDLSDVCWNQYGTGSKTVIWWRRCQFG